MQLNQATDYSFRIVLYLCRLAPGQIATAKTIAEHEEIPMRYLLKTIRSLVKAGILRSHRGTEGGYSLAKAPQDITMLDIIVAVEGPIRINRCLESSSYCTKHWCSTCPIHHALNQVQTHLIQDFGRYSFADFVEGTGGEMLPLTTPSK